MPKSNRKKGWAIFELTTKTRSSLKVQFVIERKRIVIQPEVKKMPSHGYFHVLTNHIKMGDE